MSFTDPNLNLLTKSTTHISSTYNATSTKLASLLALTLPTTGPSPRLLLLSDGTLTLTSQKKVIFSKLVPDIVVKMVTDALNKMNGDCSSFMVNLSSLLVERLTVVVRRGMSRKEISLVLKAIRKEIGSINVGCIVESMADEKGVRRVVGGILKEEGLVRVFVDALICIRDGYEQDHGIKEDDIVRMKDLSLEGSMEVEKNVKSETKTKKSVSVIRSYYESLKGVRKEAISKTEDNKETSSGSSPSEIKNTKDELSLQLSSDGNKSSQEEENKQLNTELPVQTSVIENKKIDQIDTESKQLDLNFKEERQLRYLPVKLIEELDDRIRITKIPTGTLKESFIIKGMVFNGEAQTQRKEGVKLVSSIFNCPIEISKTITKGTVLLNTAQDLLNFSKDEEVNISQTVQTITNKSNLILCNGKIEDIFLDYLDKRNVIAISIYSKHDIRRVRNLLGGDISTTLKECKTGKCKRVKVIEVGERKLTCVQGRGMVTIALRNSIDAINDENERIIQKAIITIMKNYKRGIKICRGSGEFEKRVGEYLQEKAGSFSDSKSFVYKAMADALLDLCIKKENEEIYDVYGLKIKAVQYAIDICCAILETEDHYFVRDKMNIRARDNSGWDNHD